LAARFILRLYLEAFMKRNLSHAVLAAILSAVFTIPALAQTATVKGTCRDAQGQPIVGAQVVWQNSDNGRSYKLKTNKKGEYFSLGIDPGTYTVTLTSPEGKVLDSQKNVKVGLDEITHDIDIKQIQQENIQQAAKEKGISTEEVKKQQAAAVEAEKYNANIKAVNEKLTAATNFMHAQPPNYDQAISTLAETTQMAPDQDVVWYRLGNAYLESTRAQTDKGEQTKRNTEAYNDLKKAIDLYQQRTGAAQPAQPGGAPQSSAPKPASPADNLRLAAYYDNLGQAASRLGKTDEAVNSYKQAAELDPTHSGDYYFKVGAVLTNSGGDENARKAAAAAFDKAIAADPNKADAYYWKGSNLIGMATTDSSGKLVAPEGTAEAFQKYLELQPNGPHAEEAKQMLTAMNQTVESSYGKKSTTKKK
jgi:tetratricopeptide (TPR) repeat protein